MRKASRTIPSPDTIATRRFCRRIDFAMRWKIVRVLLLVALSVSFAFAQDQTALTLDQVSDLLKSRVSSNRIAQLVEQHGIRFELNEAAMRRLKADGADEVVLSMVKKMATRYTGEQQRKRRLDEVSRTKSEDGKRQEEATERMEEVRRRLKERASRRADEQKSKVAHDAADKTRQESARKSENIKRRMQEEARQKSQRLTTATLLAPEDVGRVASLRNVMSTEAGEVSGEVVNNSRQTLREVQLQVLYSWRWKDEYRPGKDDPGTARYYLLNQEIPAGQTARFNYKPSPPLPSRQDGHFDITVKVVGFAQVFQQGRLK